MIMSKDVFIDRLYTMFRDDKVRDAASILESLRDEMYAQEAEHNRYIRELAEMHPVLYGIQRVEPYQDVDNNGTFRQRYKPVERYRVREQDIAQFAKQHKIKEADLRDVLAGKRLEVGRWRAYENLGLASKQYIDRSAKRQVQEESRQEDEAWARYNEQRNKVLEARGQTPEDLYPTDWLPQGEQ